MDLIKLKAEKQEREKQLKLIRDAAIRSKILAEEDRQRLLQLETSGNIIQRHDGRLLHFLYEEGKRQSWESTLNCSPLPQLSQLSSVNSFVTQWVRNCQHGDTTIQNVFTHTPQIVQVVNKMRAFLEVPPDDVPVQNLIEMGITYHEIRRRQQEFIDRSSYNVLTDMRSLYDPEVGIIEFQLKIEQVGHYLWANLYSCPEYVGHAFEDAEFRFRIPEFLVLVLGVYRLVKYEYDPYSELTASYFPPAAKTSSQKSTTSQNWIWKKSLLSISKSVKLAQVDGDEGAGVVEGEVSGVEAVNAEDAAPEESETFLLLKRKWKSMTMRNQDLLVGGRERQQRQEKSSGGSEASSIPQEQMTSVENRSRPQSDMSADPRVIKLTQPQENTETAEVTSQNAQLDTKQQSAGTESLPLAKEEEPKNRSIESKGRRGKGDGTEGRTKTEAELAKERERKEKEAFIPVLKPNELNLRSHRILAGIYDFKLLQLPPQPRDPGVHDCWTLHDIENHKDTEDKGGDSGYLREVSFLADYNPPPSSDLLHGVKRTPEEMEREAKRQEEELQKLVLVEMKVPKTALWFEPPTMVRWEKNEQIWSTEGFFDPRFNEDSLQLSFRMSQFGVIGLGHNRWSNLPYQSWELRPNGQNGVVLSLMAAVAVLEFTVKDDLVCMSVLQNVGNSDLVESALIGTYMKPLELIYTLRSYGLDVFPEFDSYAYVDGILVKYSESEDHLYQCMAIICSAFNCHWSRWNLLAGRNKMVYQIRERHGTATPGNYQMVLNTTRSVSLIDCTEVSPNYSEEPAREYEYHADLLVLARSIASKEALEVLETASGEFIEAVRVLLASIKFLSFA